MATQARPVDRDQPVRAGSQTRQNGGNQTVFASVHGHAQAIIAHASVVPRAGEAGRLRPHPR